MARALLAVPLALAALAAGCASSSSSAGDFTGDEKKVADQVEQIQAAGESGDAAAICDDVLAQSLRDSIAVAGSNCESEVDKAIKDADDYDLEVEDVTISGDTATAKVKGSVGDEDAVRDFEFVREGKDWRATTLG